MSRKLSVTLTAAVLAAVLVVAMYTSLPAQVGGNAGPNTADRALTQVMTGTFRVNLDTGTGTTRIDQITRIELHEQYVVLIDFRGSGRLVPMSQIRLLTWDPV